MNNELIDLKQLGFLDNDSFFDQTTYASFLNQIEDCASKIQNEEQVILVNDEVPFKFIVQTLAILILNKTPLLLSSKANHQCLRDVKKNVDFSEIKSGSQTIRKFSSLCILKKSHLIFSTSGTTGNPKLIVHDFHSLLAHVHLFKNYFNPTPHESYFLNLPVNHVGGFMLVMRAIFNRGSIVTELNSKIDYISLVPTQIATAINNKSDLLNVLQTTKCLLVGGAPLIPSIKEKLVQLKIKFYETYGMTETASFIVLNNQILPQQQVQVNHEGLVLISSPSLFIGTYENNQFISRSGDFYQTADIGELIESKFSFLGRADKMINSGGEKITLSKVTQNISDLGFFNQFQLMGFPDKKWGEILICFYNEAKDDIEKIKNDLKNKLAFYEVPKLFIPFDFNVAKRLKPSSQDFKNAYYQFMFDFKYIKNQTGNPTLIFFHGYMEDLSEWETISTQFSSDFNILLINLPGHGNTSPDLFYSSLDLVEKLKDMILSFTDSFYYLGYSMGGRVALELSKVLPPKKLILISAGIGLASEEERNSRSVIDSNLFSNISNKSELLIFLNKWYQNPIFGNFNLDPTFQNYIEVKSHFNFKLWQKGINLLTPAHFPLVGENLEFLSNQTDMIYFYGALDSKYKLVSEELKHFKNIRIVEIKDAYHKIHKTHFMELVDQLKKVLS